MSRKANYWDNAVAESFFSSLKKERIKKQIYKNRDLAKADVADYIDSFYNRMRRHSHLGGLSPEQFEAAQAAKGCPLDPGNSIWAVSGERGGRQATVYFLLCYPGNISRSYDSKRLATLLSWHNTRSVTEYELDRNMAIFAAQGNRNPLIDHPDWADEIDFKTGL
jgi:hypothetical protein